MAVTFRNTSRIYHPCSFAVLATVPQGASVAASHSGRRPFSHFAGTTLGRSAGKDAPKGDPGFRFAGASATEQMHVRQAGRHTPVRRNERPCSAPAAPHSINPTSSRAITHQDPLRSVQQRPMAVQLVIGWNVSSKIGRLDCAPARQLREP